MVKGLLANKFIVLSVSALLLLCILLSDMYSLNHLVQNNDEGIYMTTFLLMDKGHSPYRDTFMSQPPVYILAVYPLFQLFGRTIQAARLAIGIWSLIGLAAIVWIGFETGRKWFGIFVTGLLYLIPFYTRQTVVFQSDIITPTFTLIALASLLRFMKNYRTLWFVCCAIFVNAAFWTKFDITFIPALLFSLFLVSKTVRSGKKPDSLYLLKVFIVVSILFLLLFVTPFGLVDVFRNAVMLRIQASAATPPTFLLVPFLLSEPVMLILVIAGIILTFFRKDRFRSPFGLLLVWYGFTMIFFFFYRPLFDHHLAIVSIPVVLYAGILLYDLLNKRAVTLVIGIAVVIVIAASIRTRDVASQENAVLDTSRKNAVEYIISHTGPDSIVVSDEEILMAESGRLPPPELADMSSVRIYSNNLSPVEFRKTINRVRPKLIITWNGRLRSIKGFESVLTNYEEAPFLDPTDKGRKIYSLNTD